MKKFYTLLICGFFIAKTVYAVDKYWVGPLNGEWNASANWSLTSSGAGGAGAPGAADNALFYRNALIKVAGAITINSLRTFAGPVQKVTLYTSVLTNITILNNLRIDPGTVLKDSTDANVAFNVIFNKATAATGLIYGDWIFEGSVPLTGPGAGASFVSNTGCLVRVLSVPFYPSTIGGRLVFGKNTKAINSTVATLRFEYNSSFVADGNPDIIIPYATWAKDSVRAPGTIDGYLGAPASTILIYKKLVQITYKGIPDYGRVAVNLPFQSADASLALPDGSSIGGNLDIINTNDRTLTLLAANSTTGSVQVEVGTHEAGDSFGGYLQVKGLSKVALAKAEPGAYATSYKMIVNKSYKQTGGNFSLQDDNNVTGITTLAIKDNFSQTGGTFLTNSTSTTPTAKLLLVMADPNYMTGPSLSFHSHRTISLSSGSIDNAAHNVTLKIDHTVYAITLYEDYLNGIILNSPLTVGRLELARSPLTTTITNIITVANPAVDAVTVGTTGKSYVNGPIIRAMSTTANYSFPTGKGNTTETGYVFAPCEVTLTTAVSSKYRAEYHNTAYTDLSALAPLEGVSPAEYWSIAKLSGADAKLRLILHGAVPGVGASKGLVVARFKASDWLNENGSILTPGNSTSGSAVSKALTGYGAFTFGYGVPSRLSALTVALADGHDNVSSIFPDRAENTDNVKIFPNPFAESFTISFYNASTKQARVSIEVYDVKGALVYSYHPANLVPGNNVTIVDLYSQHLPAGVYMAQLKINGITSNTVKLFKKR